MIYLRNGVKIERSVKYIHPPPPKWINRHNNQTMISIISASIDKYIVFRP